MEFGEKKAWGAEEIDQLMKIGGVLVVMRSIEVGEDVEKGLVKKQEDKA